MNGRRAPLIAGAAAVVAAVAAVVLLVLPKMSEVSETQGELQAAQDRELALEAQVRSLEEAQAQAPETERQIALIEDQVPPTADLPTLFRLLDSAADRAAVDFFSFSPGTPVVDPSGGFSTIASQVTVTGGYFALDEFLFLMETLPRAAKVTSIAVAPGVASAGGATSTTTSLQLQATVEFYTTDASAGPGSSPGPTEGVPTGA